MTLIERHGWEAESVEQRDRKLRFSDGDHADYLPVGQWLVAMEHCQQGHTMEDFGDPCYCGSDNCAYCAKCGVESHD